jgi:oligopeptide transport system substrate-binding protein
MFKKKTPLFFFSFVLSLVMVAPLLASCGGSSAAPTAAPTTASAATSAPAGSELAADQSFTFNNGAEPETLDPAIMTGDPEQKIIFQLLEGLTTYNPKDLTPAPGVAEKWDVSADNLTYTFHLRDTKWTNGDPITANDFIYSWRRALDPQLNGGKPSDYAYQLYYIKGAQDFNEGKITDFNQVGLKATDPKTLVVTLVDPTPFFLDITSFQTLLPVHQATVEKFTTDWTKPENFVGNGAYKMTEWKPQQDIILEKNPDYWDAANVKLTKVKILPIDDNNTALAMYEKGDCDWLRTLPVEQVDAWKSKPETHITPFLTVYFYRFNVTKAPFDNADVRKAFDQAVDKESIVKNVTKAGQVAAKAFVPPGTPGYKGVEDQGLAYDPAAAKALLAKAGYPDGKGFPTVQLLYNTSESHKAIAEAIQQMWKTNLGVNVELVNQEWKVYLTSQSNLDYQVSRSGWVGDYPDPKTFLDMFVTGGGNNQTGWSNKAYDDLIAKTQTDKTTDERMADFAAAEKILVVDEMPIMPIYYYVNINVLKPYVQGMDFNLIDVHYFKYLSIAKH